jgi:hypothetical protein
VPSGFGGGAGAREHRQVPPRLSAVAGRLDFTAHPHDLGPPPKPYASARFQLPIRALGVFARQSPACTEVLAIDPRDLGFVFRALATPLEPCRSRDESRPVPPLVALPAFPLRRAPAASTPGPHFAEAMCVPSGRGFQPRLSFRPRGFSPPRRFPPQQACGFVAPRFRP